jgi:hypothetical protein
MSGSMAKAFGLVKAESHTKPKLGSIGVWQVAFPQWKRSPQISWSPDNPLGHLPTETRKTLWAMQPWSLSAAHCWSHLWLQLLPSQQCTVHVPIPIIPCCPPALRIRTKAHPNPTKSLLAVGIRLKVVKQKKKMTKEQDKYLTGLLPNCKSFTVSQHPHSTG